MAIDPKNISEHESPLRKMVADSQGLKYEAIETLDKAKETKNSYLIMEGDDGGQIYLVAPVEIVKADPQTLHDLLKDLDARKWNDLSMARMYYEIHDVGSGIPGGMGGGIAERGLWVHEGFREIIGEIEKVIRGVLGKLVP
jgi:hypothetical protein